MNPDHRILGVFAKMPVEGRVKTRLAQSTSAVWALRVAQALLEDSLDRFSQIDASRVIVFAPQDAMTYFAQLAQGRFEAAPQCAGDLGCRLHYFFTDARRNGYSRIAVIGSDSPTLPVEYVEQAFELLGQNDVVIGPAMDGGYYLIGSGPRELPIFEQIPWSTPRVLEATVERMNESLARLALLPPWYDVDTADDWALLRGHVLALRQAGVDPGVPRVERLIQDSSASRAP